MRSNKTNKKQKIRVVIYIRYSSHRQAESFSIEYQLAECKKFCEQNGYILVEVYIDEAKSGKKVAGREEFDKMIYDASLNKFDKIVVFSFSRSFRNTRDALNYNHDLMEKYGIMIESVIERIDMSDPHGKFSGTNLFAMHELQADIIAAHVRSGMYYAAQQGYYLGGQVTFGYELYGTGEFTRGKERKKFRPNKRESAVVKEIFSLYADGFSLEFIQQSLRDRGVIARRGRIIGNKTITGILRNRAYIGEKIYKFKNQDELVVKNATPPLVDMETWNKVQAKHAKHKQVAPRRTKRLYSLTGTITCAKCGAHMFGMYQGHSAGNKNPYSYYICSNRKERKTCNAPVVRKEHIEEYCLKQIKHHILNEKAMRSISKQIATKVGDTSDEMSIKLEKASRRKEKISDILMNIKKDVYEGEITKEMGDKMSAQYEAELNEMENTIITLSSALQSAVTPESVYLYLQELLSHSESNKSEIIKMVFDKLIEKILVYDDRIEVHLVVIPFAHITDKNSNGQPYWSLLTKIGRKEI